MRNIAYRYTAYIVVISVISMTGCSSAPYSRQNKLYVTYNGFPKKSSYSISRVKNILKQQEKHWRGTRYKMGGLSRKGIDCSGFVYITFKDDLGIELPRSTKLQVNIGNFVNKKTLQIGDLVFFKTGLKVRHVGIYVGNLQFIHASTSKGVMVSNLENPYWYKKYWKAKRVIYY